jgi:hypothetical protein
VAIRAGEIASDGLSANAVRELSAIREGKAVDNRCRRSLKALVPLVFLRYGNFMAERRRQILAGLQHPAIYAAIIKNHFVVGLLEGLIDARPMFR